MQNDLKHSHFPLPTSDFIRVLLVSEGTGGHLIPAVEVARVLAAQQVDVLLL